MTRSKLVKKCDKLFSIFIRLHFADKDWYVRCYTCWKKMKWNDKECSCGHWITRAFFFLRWNINNARPQCMRKCNSKLSGNWEPLIFRKNLINEIGIEEVESMENDYIEYRKDPSWYKVHTFTMEYQIQELQKAIKAEADLRGIVVKV